MQHPGFASVTQHRRDAAPVSRRNGAVSGEPKEPKPRCSRGGSPGSKSVSRAEAELPAQAIALQAQLPQGAAALAAQQAEKGSLRSAQAGGRVAEAGRCVPRKRLDSGHDCGGPCARRLRGRGSRARHAGARSTRTDAIVAEVQHRQACARHERSLRRLPPTLARGGPAGPAGAGACSREARVRWPALRSGPANARQAGSSALPSRSWGSGPSLAQGDDDEGHRRVAQSVAAQPQLPQARVGVQQTSPSSYGFARAVARLPDAVPAEVQAQENPALGRGAEHSRHARVPKRVAAQVQPAQAAVPAQHRSVRQGRLQRYGFQGTGHRGHSGLQRLSGHLDV
mmetsp:Transcript_4186/g.17691  ORF Transcript_4186/g.17691 Transcript_4186/m.17691 type:complete len:340 (-) Transcript_4186:697-1716(-)